MNQEIVVVVEETLPDIQVTLSPDITPDVEVIFSEVGLVGREGEVGPQGPTGATGSTGDAMALALHIDSLLPHPVYDDGPSFLLLYQNAKV